MSGNGHNSRYHLALGAASELADAAARAPIPSSGPVNLRMQADRAAHDWADRRGEPVTPEHLLVALLDQRSEDVVATLEACGLTVDGVRASLLRRLGLPPDLAPIPLPAPFAAGTIDRPALPIGELPAEVWASLQWRQQHLPLRRLNSPQAWAGLYHLERRAAWRAADRAGVNDDVRYSLLHHHNKEVERRAATVAPDLAPTGCPPIVSQPIGTLTHRRRRRRRLRVPNVFVGWPCWFKNRLVELNAAWFKYSTLHYYRGQPRVPA